MRVAVKIHDESDFANILHGAMEIVSLPDHDLVLPESPQIYSLGGGMGFPRDVRSRDTDAIRQEL